MLMRVLLILLALVLPMSAWAVDMNVTGSGTVAIAQGLALTPAPSLCGVGNASRGIDAAGNATGCFLPTGGSGNVANTGTPLDNQIAVWTSATVIEGLPSLTFTTGILAVGTPGTGGRLDLVGATAGIITVQPSSSTPATYNFNLPNAAGAAGEVLTSGGGGVAPMTWSVPGDITAVGSCTTGACFTTTTPSAQLYFTVGAAPAVPGAGQGVVYVDTTNTNLNVMNNAGVVKHGVQTKTRTGTEFLTAINDAGVVSAAQAVFGDLTGTLGCSQFPVLSGDLSNAISTCNITIATNAVSLTKMADIATSTMLGRVLPGTGDPQALTPAEARTVLQLDQVTNFAQLKRDANDFSVFPSKGAPIAADLLLIEDSAAAGIKKFVTVGSLPISDVQIPDLNTLSTGLLLSRCVQTNGTDGKLSVAAGPCGSSSGAGIFGAPIAGQVAVWHDGASIEGASALTISYAALPVASSGTATTGIEYVDASTGGGVTRTLPAAASGTNSRRFTFVKNDGGPNPMIIAPNGTNTINGISGVPGSISTSTQWAGFILQEVSTTGWVATPFVPTIGATTLPGGATGDVQWNNGGVLAGSAGVALSATQVLGVNQRVTPLGGAGGAATTALTSAHGPIIACTGGTGDKTMALPAVGVTPKSTWIIVKVDAGIGACEFAPAAGERINGVVNAKARATTQNSQIRVDVLDTTTPNWAAVSGKTLIDLADLAPASGASLLLGRGSAAGGGSWQETTLVATELAFTGTQLGVGTNIAKLGISNTWAAGVKQTFTPNATNAGLNSGSFSGNPSTLANGDLWYNSTGNVLNARINGATVALGATATPASETAAGVIEIATPNEITQALAPSATLAMSPRNFSLSGYGRRYISLECIPEGTAITTGTGKCFFNVHDDFAGWVIIDVKVALGTVASTGGNGAVSVNVDICGAVPTGNKCTGTNRALFTTPVTVDQNEDSSSTANAPMFINIANDDLAADEWLRVNVGTPVGTGAAGLYVTFVLARP